jgi:histidinol-phosphate aminotransferase
MTDPRPATGLRALLRSDLQDEKPYGAPQLTVRAALNTNENSYPVPPEVVSDMLAELTTVLPTLNRYPDREFTDLRGALAAYLSPERDRFRAGPGVGRQWVQ